MLGKTATNLATGSGTSATTLSAITNRYQVIRTGSGSIDINAARDIQFLNQFATIYTAGTAVADITLGGFFKVPSLTPVNSNALGVAQQNYAVQYSMAGGDVNLQARQATSTAGPSPTRRPSPIPNCKCRPTGFTARLLSMPPRECSAVDIETVFHLHDLVGGFQQLLPGGRSAGWRATSLSSPAGGINNVDAVIPTNARMPGYTQPANRGRQPDASRLVELGGGDLAVVSGRDINAGVYYVERGVGRLSAGGGIHTNATRSVLDADNLFLASTYTQLPTTLFLGKGIFDIKANGDILLGPVANPFLLPGGQLNGYFNKSYFSTYQEGSGVTVESLGGNVTLRTAASQFSGFSEPLLAPVVQEQAPADRCFRLRQETMAPFERTRCRSFPQLVRPATGYTSRHPPSAVM